MAWYVVVEGGYLRGEKGGCALGAMRGHLGAGHGASRKMDGSSRDRLSAQV